MFPLFETFCIKQGKIERWDWHIARMRQSLQILYKQTSFPYHQLWQTLQSLPLHERLKVKVLYNHKTFSHTYQPYIIKKINKIYWVEDPMQYALKYTQRSAFDRYNAHVKVDEEILIIQQGLVTDVRYANIVCFDGKNWHTPAESLLPGTHRAALLANHIIQQQTISLHDLFHTYKQLMFINAMLDWGEVIVDTKNIFPLPL